MNKYQEAFNYLFGAVHINPSKETYNKNVQIIKELVDKETPKVVITKTYMSATHDIYGSYLKTKYLCSNCKKEIDYSSYKYCPHCGQKLDWSDDND